jgi:hypothetical protein
MRRRLEARRPDPKGRDTLQVVEVRLEPDQVTLVVKPPQPGRYPVVP